MKRSGTETSPTQSCVSLEKEGVQFLLKGCKIGKLGLISFIISWKNVCLVKKFDSLSFIANVDCHTT